jgi:hypothetical protein
MDPKCACGKSIDAKNDINIEEIDGGAGDRNYSVAIVYCEHCQAILGVIPSKKMITKIVKDAMK